MISHLGLPLAIVVLAVWGYRVIPGWRYQMNPDGISYLSIVRKYLAGHFYDAINAYWSPMYSWLLAPLIAGGVESLLATKILALIIGEAILATVWWIGANLRIPRDTRQLVCLTLCPILIHFGMYVTTPDLLVTAALMLYLAQMTRARYEERWYSRPVTGLLGAAMYLAKAYAMPFFLAHFTLVNVVDLARQPGRRRRVFATALLGYLSFAIVGGAWAACLTHKYGYFTTGSTGKFNLAWNGPKFKIPHVYQGFMPPPDELGTSSWDDATLYKVEEWNPLGSPEEREHFRKNRERNWNSLELINENFTWFLWPIVILGATVAGTRGGDPAPRRPGFILVSALLLYPIGYYLLHVEERFLSQMCVMLLLIGAWMIASAAHAFGFGPVRRAVATAVVCLSFLYVPDWEKKPPASPAGLSLLNFGWMLNRWSVAGGWGTGRDMAAIADHLRGVIPQRSRVASVGSWGTLFPSYLLNLSYWGEPKPGAMPAQIEADLHSMDIEYFWIWGDLSKYPFVNGWSEITPNAAPGLHIYRVPAKPASPRAS